MKPKTMTLDESEIKELENILETLKAIRPEHTGLARLKRRIESGVKLWTIENELEYQGRKPERYPIGTLVKTTPNYTGPRDDEPLVFRITGVEIRADIEGSIMETEGFTHREIYKAESLTGKETVLWPDEIEILEFMKGDKS